MYFWRAWPSAPCNATPWLPEGFVPVSSIEWNTLILREQWRVEWTDDGVREGWKRCQTVNLSGIMSCLEENAVEVLFKHSCQKLFISALDRKSRGGVITWHNVIVQFLNLSCLFSCISEFLGAAAPASSLLSSVRNWWGAKTSLIKTAQLWLLIKTSRPPC